jgi:hypothetical protein
MNHAREPVGIPRESTIKAVDGVERPLLYGIFLPKEEGWPLRTRRTVP